MSEEKIIFDPNEFVIEDGVLLQYLGNKTTVKVPDGVTEVSAEAFLFTDPYGNLRPKNIISLYLPESVQELNCSFEGTKITKFKADGLKVILGDQFRKSNLETVDCPNVLQVNNYAFNECVGLKKVNLPNVKLIGESAFSTLYNDYSQLKEINLPNLVEVRESAFNGCAFTKINFPNLRIIGPNAFSYCKRLVEVDCPNVEEFYDRCFFYCKSLSKVNMPKAKPKNGEHSINAGINGAYFGECDNLNTATLATPWSELLKRGVIINSDGTYQPNKSGGCYVATCVYGSYDCPEVWTLRRFRDYKLASSWYGKLFIKLYYATSPTLVKWFGNTNWFKKLWYKPLNDLVTKLNNEGYENSPYND